MPQLTICTESVAWGQNGLFSRSVPDLAVPYQDTLDRQGLHLDRPTARRSPLAAPAVRTMRIPLVRFCSSFLLVASAASPATAQSVVLPSNAAIRETFNVDAWSIQRLSIPAELTHHVDLSVRIDGQDVDLALSHHNLRAHDYETLVIGADGIPVSTDVGPSRTFRGPAQQISDSLTVASIWGGSLHAVIYVEGSTGWGIQPLTEIDPGMDPTLHIVYATQDILASEFKCATEETFVSTNAGGAFFGTGLSMVEIAFDSDVEFFNLNGGSVTSTVNDIELILNNMTAIYESDIQVTYMLTTAVVRTSQPDPYTTADALALLNQFGTELATGLSFIKRDVAHLMTGRNLQGGTLGIATVGTVCNDAA
ncbi:MAG: hypothetical protein ACI841_004785, partial [Planctomycetota bacterium]